MSDKDKENIASTGTNEAPAQAVETPAVRRNPMSLNNNVKEEIVFKHKKMLSMIIYVVLMISAVFFGLIGAIALMGIVGAGGINFGNIINLVIFGGGAVLMWFGKDYMRVEYEYTFTNGVVDIAQVMNNRRRKELISFKTREVELVAPVEDPKLHNIEARQGVKKIKAVLNVDSAIYFASFRKNDVQYLVYFEPSPEFLKFMRIYNDRNIII
jgi:hypothetical protein